MSPTDFQPSPDPQPVHADREDLPDNGANPGRGVLGWIVAFLAALMLYGATAAQGIQWQDSGNHVLRVVTHDANNDMGLALTHPLHHWLGRIFVALLPLEPAHSMSLLSALGGAVTVANVFGIVRQLTQRLSPAVLAVLGLGVAHTFWRLATIPETYTLATALLSAEMWAVVSWSQTRRPIWLVAAFLASGLGFANHNLALLTLPVTGSLLLIALWHRQATWRTLIASGVAWAIGASPFLFLIIRQMLLTGLPLGTLHSALFGDFETGVLNVGGNARPTILSAAFTLLSFPNLTLPVALFGMMAWRSAGVPVFARRALLAALVIHGLFVLRYNVIDQYLFLLPAYTLLCVFAGVGYASILARFPERLAKVAFTAAWISVLATPALYAIIPDLARKHVPLGSQDRRKPFRDDYAYFLIPWGIAETSADRMSRRALELAGTNGLIVVEDDMGRFAVRYRRVMDRRSDVKVVSPDQQGTIRRARDEGKPMVWIPLRRDDPAPFVGANWRRDGDFYIHPSQPGSAPLTSASRHFK